MTKTQNPKKDEKEGGRNLLGSVLRYFLLQVETCPQNDASASTLYPIFGREMLTVPTQPKEIMDMNCRDEQLSVCD